jgi:flagellar M-ring protein FliF
VSADFVFNRITETSDKYDPEGRVVRSSQTREETSATETRDNQVTVGNEIPGGGAQRGSAAPAENNTPPREQNRKSEEIVNYEISKTTKTEVIEGGRVNRISVAVLVDGVYGKNDRGDVVYEPRTKEEIEQIAALVRTAIGFDQKRGDQVEVVNLRFAETQATPINEPGGFLAGMQFTKDDIMRAIELGVMGLLGLVVLLMVVRPLVKRMLAPEAPAVAALPAGGTQLTDVLAAVESIKAEPSETARKIDIAQIQGQVHAQSVQKVGELADRNPNEAVSIIRQWMTETHAS